jgi:hypothetical protein
MIRPLHLLGMVALVAAAFVLGSYLRGAERDVAAVKTPADSEEVAARLRSIDAELRRARRDREAPSPSDAAERDRTPAVARTEPPPQPAPGAGVEPSSSEAGGEPPESAPTAQQLALEADAEALLSDAIRAGAWRDDGEFRGRVSQLTKAQQVALAERMSAALNEGKLALSPGQIPF